MERVSEVVSIVLIGITVAVIASVILGGGALLVVKLPCKRMAIESGRPTNVVGLTCRIEIAPELYVPVADLYLYLDHVRPLE